VLFRSRDDETAAGEARTPIVALSANVVAEEAEKCAAAGMDDFVAKPVPMPTLAEKLWQWMPHLEWPTTTPRPPRRPAAEESVPEQDGVIDESVLRELTGGDDDLAAAVLQDFVDSSLSDLTALCLAVADASADEVRRQAHRIKGAGRTVGATQVATLAARLELATSCAVEDWTALRSTADELEAAVARVAATVTTAFP
jgi:two-component system sensor histidine kinase EvgS